MGWDGMRLRSTYYATSEVGVGGWASRSCVPKRTAPLSSKPAWLSQLPAPANPTVSSKSSGRQFLAGLGACSAVKVKVQVKGACTGRHCPCPCPCPCPCSCPSMPMLLPCPLPCPLPTRTKPPVYPIPRLPLLPTAHCPLPVSPRSPVRPRHSANSSQPLDQQFTTTTKHPPPSAHNIYTDRIPSPQPPSVVCD